MDAIKASEAVILKHLEILQNITATPGDGVTRFPYTKEAKQACEYLSIEMKKLGLNVTEHPSGSIIGRLQGELDETIMLGSHYDTVLHGGAYDGIAGVIVALEAVRLFLKTGKPSRYSIEVIAANDEEGVRFKTGLFTGKVFWGKFMAEDLKKFTDKDNVTLYEAMQQYGIDPDRIAEGKRDPSKIIAFLEAHIEQGPILENDRCDIGRVSAIVGFRRKVITIGGRADHSGTMPMNMRIDAVEIAAKAIAGFGDIARCHPDAVATVGYMEVEPNAMNTIAGKVVFSTDVRSADSDVIDKIYVKFEKNLKEIVNKFHGTCQIVETLNALPVKMDQKLQKMLKESCDEKHFTSRAIVSGAGHDAQVMGTMVPTEMLFVPSKNGRSHCPEEFTDGQYFAQAAIIFEDMIEKICSN